MPFIFEYLLKLSISLAVVYLFYYFILSRLTFYNHHRWYLLAYSLFSFFIPFINLSPALHKNELANSGAVQWVPLLYQPRVSNITSPEINYWQIATIIILAGMTALLCRLLIQLWSFRKMLRSATLIASQQVNIYQVDGKVTPFSFGNAVFINPALHSSVELEEIIRHEFVHVKQRHSIDILFAEILCLLNWFNPFAWLIRSSIRQNLEFIADNQVLEKGANKKQYQYLLLKVIGNNQFSIAPKFNFSSLKKRIAMMNKLQTNKKQLLRFLLLLPVLAIVLLSFRKEIKTQFTGKGQARLTAPLTDTLPPPSALNNKGYQITVKDNKGNCLLVIKDEKGKEVKRMLLDDWNKDSAKYEALYGQIPPPPPPPPAQPAMVEGVILEELPVPPTPPAVNDLPPTVTSVVVNNSTVTVKLKDGTEEIYNKASKEDMKKFETKYGRILPSSPTPPTPAKARVVEVRAAATPQAPFVTIEEKELPDNVLYVLDDEVTDKSVVNGLDPSAIKSIDVLKGSTAEAIYGEKGKGGVIKIKTKITEVVAPTGNDLKEIKAGTMLLNKISGTVAPAVSVTGKPAPALYEVTIDEKDILNIGSLSMKDEKQFILVDGKEFNPRNGEKLKGTFRITFLDKKEAEKKFGAKARNGAIIAETIK